MNKKKNQTSRTQPKRRKRRRKRPSQRDWRVDVQKWLGKTGIEFHWPGYQFMGPGTHLEKRLKRGDKGINRMDRIAKQHDIDYSHAKHDGTRGQENHTSQETFEIVKKKNKHF